MSKALSEFTPEALKKKKASANALEIVGIMATLSSFICFMIVVFVLLSPNKLPPIDMLFSIQNGTQVTHIPYRTRMRYLPHDLEIVQNKCAEQRLKCHLEDISIVSTRNITPQANQVLLKLFANLATSTQLSHWKPEYQRFMDLEKVHLAHVRKVEYQVMAVILIFILLNALLLFLVRRMLNSVKAEEKRREKKN